MNGERNKNERYENEKSYYKRTNSQSGKTKEKPVESIRMIPLGGLNEIGKNMTVYECMGDMFIVDCGNSFPDSEMFGVDLVIPDFTYIIENVDKIKGIIITHGHEDHIGSLPYLLREVNLPVYATPLTKGLIENKLSEHSLKSVVDINVMKPGDKIKMGCMTVVPIHVNHSIPDAVGLAIESPAGTVVMTGDFKIDYTPPQGETTDLATFAEYGRKGVLAFLSDSTNAERRGSSASEKTVGRSFEQFFDKAAGKRIIIATFASNIYRIQQILDLAIKHNRKVAVSGRSMINNIQMAFDLGYLKAPDNVMIDAEKVKDYEPGQIVLITTGSQGEPLSALSRMAGGTHRQFSIGPSDFIIISATPIPGNEKMVTKVVNGLLKLGATVIYESMYDVHVSGHACQEELKLMLNLVKPQFFIPVHGEYKHLKRHAMLAENAGMATENIILGNIGEVLKINVNGITVEETITAGQVLVDGLGVGDVGSVVLRDRKHLAQDGMIVVCINVSSQDGSLISGPDIITRGFIYVKESEDMLDELRNITLEAVERCNRKHIRDWTVLKSAIKNDLSGYLFKTTRRNPMILPVIMEV